MTKELFSKHALELRDRCKEELYYYLHTYYGFYAEIKIINYQ